MAVKLSKTLDGEIISADSRQVYKGMDIGTGKEGTSKNTECLMSNSKPRINYIKCRAKYIDEVPQYLIDIVEPGGEMYNLKNFLDDAKLVIEDIWARGKTPIVAGGTGLYVSALAEGYELSPVKLGRGKWRARKKPEFIKLIIGIEMPREKIYERIDARLKKRIKEGLIQEVQTLVDGGVGADWLEKIGLDYRFVSRRLRGEIADDETLYNQLRFAIHAYARRQLTWLRHKINGVEWVRTGDEALILARNFLRTGDRPEGGL